VLPCGVAFARNNAPDLRFGGSDTGVEEYLAMKASQLGAMVSVFCLACCPQEGRGAGDERDELQGVWAATAGEIRGKPATTEEIKGTRFTFKGNKLLVRSPTLGVRELEGTFEADRRESPRGVDIDLIKLDGIWYGIYEIKGDELRICYRIGGKPENRPTTFATAETESLIVIVFKRQKP
jgi:uncharacterized protein (TIGR03067 family)